MIDDTIAAIATPPGKGGVAVVRISGCGAEDILRAVFSKNGEYEPNRMYFGKVVDNGETVDSGYAVLFRAPLSYTGEDVAELHCHGSAVGVKRIMELLVLRGARLAEPGEFTKRAFMNGKLDLTQAEAVCDYIGAVSGAGAKSSARQMEGALKEKLLDCQSRLTDIIAEVEAAVEYPEEDLELEITDNALPEIEKLRGQILALADTYTKGRLVREGVNVAIAGKPNVGKSSLMNALVGSERAIVSSISGTTRDTIEHAFELDGIAFNLVDTAGIRSTDDLIELEGVKRADIALNEADLVIFVLDICNKMDENDHFVSERLKDMKDIVIPVWNKIDACEGRSETQIPEWMEGVKAEFISAKTGDGIDGLKNRLREFASMEETESVIITNARHMELLRKSAEHLGDAAEALRVGVDMDCITIDLNLAWAALGGLTGNTVSEEIVDRIFSKFCLGK